MLPDHILPQLSPAAAKIYLILLCAHRNSAAPLPYVTLPMYRIAQLASLSRRTCTSAIRQLCDLQLIHRPPHGFHMPTTYQFLRPPADPSAQHISTIPHVSEQPTATIDSEDPDNDPENAWAQSQNEASQNLDDLGTQAQPTAPIKTIRFSDLDLCLANIPRTSSTAP